MHAMPNFGFLLQFFEESGKPAVARRSGKVPLLRRTSRCRDFSLKKMLYLNSQGAFSKMYDHFLNNVKME